MRELVKERLPKFSSQDEVNVTFDFVGLNYYTAYYAANANPTEPDHLRYQTDSNTIIQGKNFVIFSEFDNEVMPCGFKASWGCYNIISPCCSYHTFSAKRDGIPLGPQV